MTKDGSIEKPWQSGQGGANQQHSKGWDKPITASELTAEGATKGTSTVAFEQDSPDIGGSQPRFRPRLPKNWQFWAGVVVFVSGTAGFMATASLLKSSTIPNCPKIFLPTASASMRLYCAQTAAQKGTKEDLLEAIALVEALPIDHPLRSQINAAVEEWSQELIRLADDTFQQGDIKGAIATLQEIPRKSPAYRLVEERIARWNGIWSEAEELAEEVEGHLRQSEWNLAFRTAVKLTQVDNEYWASTRFDQLAETIRFAREESRQLDSAYAALSQGGVDNLLEVVKIAKKIPSDSYVYKQAQDLIKEAGNELIAIAQQHLDNNNWSGVLAVTRRIPPSLNLYSQVQSMETLARAGTNAKIGTIPSLETAILEAQSIEPNTPLYNKTQALITRWQLEIEDVARLNQARRYAQRGGITNLSMAISQAKLIPANNPRSQEAQREISQWQSKIQVLQDRPILDRAIQLASYGTVAALQEGIEEASQIKPNRTLSDEAQEKIQQWQRQIQIKQDQPILDRADQLANLNTPNALRSAISEASQIRNNRALSDQAQQKIRTWQRELETQEDQPTLNEASIRANRGDLQGAVAIARQVNPGRALYEQAQERIQIWERQIQAEENFRQASQIAQSQDPAALARAIQLARQVPDNTDLSSESRRAANRWSSQLLSIAESQANINLSEAIRIAKLIPKNTTAYNNAQIRIQTWERLLNPPSPEPLSLPRQNF
jgi:hypothetical protein